MKPIMCTLTLDFILLECANWVAITDEIWYVSALFSDSLFGIGFKSYSLGVRSLVEVFDIAK